MEKPDCTKTLAMVMKMVIRLIVPYSSGESIRASTTDTTKRMPCVQASSRILYMRLLLMAAGGVLMVLLSFIAFMKKSSRHYETDGQNMRECC